MIRQGDWPPGVEDGLTLACEICEQHPVPFAFRVSDDCWESVFDSDDPARRGVVCLKCFDHLAVSRGVEIIDHLEEVQFIGAGRTIVLKPERMVYHDTAIEVSRHPMTVLGKEVAHWIAGALQDGSVAGSAGPTSGAAVAGLKTLLARRALTAPPSNE